MKVNMQFSGKKKKLGLLHDIIITLLSIHPKDSNLSYNRNAGILMFTVALLTIAKL